MNHTDTRDTRLSDAFRELRAKGLFARQNFTCCQNCGWAAIEGDPVAKAKAETAGAVFYHGQDADGLRETGRTYLAWTGDPNVIVATLVKHGLGVRWAGDSRSRIEVVTREREGDQ